MTALGAIFRRSAFRYPADRDLELGAAAGEVAPVVYALGTDLAFHSEDAYDAIEGAAFVLIGNVVYLRGRAVANAGSQTFFLDEIPEELRPSGLVSIPVHMTVYDDDANHNVHRDGRLYVWDYGSVNVEVIGATGVAAAPDNTVVVYLSGCYVAA